MTAPPEIALHAPTSAPVFAAASPKSSARHAAAFAKGALMPASISLSSSAVAGNSSSAPTLRSLLATASVPSMNDGSGSTAVAPPPHPVASHTSETGGGGGVGGGGGASSSARGGTMSAGPSPSTIAASPATSTGSNVGVPLDYKGGSLAALMTAVTLGTTGAPTAFAPAGTGGVVFRPPPPPLEPPPAELLAQLQANAAAQAGNM